MKATAFRLVAMAFGLVLSHAFVPKLNETCEDASVLQLGTRMTEFNPNDPNWRLGALGQSCTTVCGDDVCDADKASGLTFAQVGELGQRFVPDVLGDGKACEQVVDLSTRKPLSPLAPYILFELQNSRATCFSSSLGSMSCSKEEASSRRVCYCEGGPSGGLDGDPHIHTFRGDHYTLLEQGTYVAWSFSKVPVEWQLLASYAGAASFTKGLLLKHSGPQSIQAMEITAQDCVWRSKGHDGWHVPESQLVWSGDQSFEIKEMKGKSKIIMSMKSEDGMRKVATLMTHCKPFQHLDFRVTMSSKSDLDYAGGEVGAKADGHGSQLFSQPPGVTKMKTDAEFKASASWVELGGSEAAAEYLKMFTSQQGEESLVSTCTETEEKMAKKTCGKYLNEEVHKDYFEDCVFDLCHGGSEADAQSTAALISA